MKNILHSIKFTEDIIQNWLAKYSANIQVASGSSTAPNTTWTTSHTAWETIAEYFNCGYKYNTREIDGNELNLNISYNHTFHNLAKSYNFNKNLLKDTNKNL